MLKMVRAHGNAAEWIPILAVMILWLGAQSPEFVSGTTLDVNNGSYPR